jgi:hypothetical protein
VVSPKVEWRPVPFVVIPFRQLIKNKILENRSFLVVGSKTFCRPYPQKGTVQAGISKVPLRRLNQSFLKISEIRLNLVNYVGRL